MNRVLQMYVLRIWYEPCQQGDVWRASVTHVHTQEKRYFQSMDELMGFLKRESAREFEPPPTEA